MELVTGLEPVICSNGLFIMMRTLRATDTTVRKFDECSAKLQKTKTVLLEEMVENLYNNICLNK